MAKFKKSYPFKSYKHETRDKINDILELCKRKAISENSACFGVCSKCKLSDTYEGMTGVRLEEIEND